MGMSNAAIDLAQPAAAGSIHIRKCAQGGKDMRLALRHQYRGSNKAKPTLCGAEPTGEDLGRADGRHWLTNWRPNVRRSDCPAWAKDLDSRLCPTCVAILKSKDGAR